MDDTDYKRILEIFKKYDVRYFFYNGGNDSMDTCNKISKYMQKVGYECRVMGVPKTIDNDLFEPTTAPASPPPPSILPPAAWRSIRMPGCMTPAWSASLRSWAATPAGWLAAALATGAGPDLVYLLVDFGMDQFLADVGIYKEEQLYGRLRGHPLRRRLLRLQARPLPPTASATPSWAAPSCWPR